MGSVCSSPEKKYKIQPTPQKKSVGYIFFDAKHLECFPIGKSFDSCPLEENRFKVDDVIFTFTEFLTWDAIPTPSFVVGEQGELSQFQIVWAFRRVTYVGTVFSIDGIPRDSPRLKFDLYGRFHNVGGPAINFPNVWAYARNGVLHRADGPAFCTSSVELFAQSGKVGRSDHTKPSLIIKDGKDVFRGYTFVTGGIEKLEVWTKDILTDTIENKELKEILQECLTSKTLHGRRASGTL